MTIAESKIIYDGINAYVKEHTGLQVNNSYYAKVKRKCGIIKRKDYNRLKSENFRQPDYPQEKETAIREALEHFRMI